MRLAQCAPLSFFSVLPEKKDSAAPGVRKKRALRAIDNSVFDTLYARLPNPGADCIQVGNLFAPVSAECFAYARAAAGKDRRGRWPRPASLAPSGQFTFCPHRPAFGSCIGSIWGSTPTDFSPGRIQRGAAAPLCVVSNRESQGRGRNRNLPLPCGVSFATFLWPNKEKLNTQPAPADQNEKNDIRFWYQYPSRGMEPSSSPLVMERISAS